MKRRFAFFFHYNKPASRRAGHTILSLHYGGACHFVRNIDLRVPVVGRHNKRQPYFVLAGKAGSIEIDKDGTALVTVL